MEFYLVFGKRIHKRIRRLAIVVVLVDGDAVEVHEHSAGEVSSLERVEERESLKIVASQIRITLDHEAEAANPWVLSSVLQQLLSGNLS